MVRGDLLSVLSDSLTGVCLPLSWRAVLTSLSKKGDLQLINNWRSGSLLCSDYKLLSKVLATRLSRVVEQVIQCDQTYCVPGRLISDNIVFICDVLEIRQLFLKLASKLAYQSIKKKLLIVLNMNIYGLLYRGQQIS